MRHVACALLIVLSSLIGVAGAQDLEPRLYSNIPLDVNFLVLGYTRSVGSVLVDPAIELEDADLTIDGPVLGYARALGFGGLSGKFDIGLANVCLSGLPWAWPGNTVGDLQPDGTLSFYHER